MIRLELLGGLALSAALATACGDDARPSAPAASGGDAGTSGASSHSGSGASAGDTSTAGSAGEAAGGGGDGDGGGEAGNGGAPGGSGGSAGSAQGGEVASGGSGEVFPPIGPDPACPKGVAWATGTRLNISGAGDDELQSIAPNELTIAWKSGADFYIAERVHTNAEFGPALLVEGDSQYSAVSLHDDGLGLVAVKGLKVVELTRQPGEAFSDASSSEGAFSAFNTGINGDPSPDKELHDAVLGAGAQAFFYSQFSTGMEGAAPSEARLREGLWTSTGQSLGAHFGSDAAGNRRVPTGVSSDVLTLFYRDEVEGDFRAAWRVNDQQMFDHVEAVTVATGISAAAPNYTCGRLYYSAPGTEGIDIFVSERQQ
jgi:hypothetical protein